MPETTLPYGLDRSRNPELGIAAGFCQHKYGGPSDRTVNRSVDGASRR